MFSKPLIVITPRDVGDEGRLSCFVLYVSELKFLYGNTIFYLMYSKNVENKF